MKKYKLLSLNKFNSISNEEFAKIYDLSEPFFWSVFNREILNFKTPYPEKEDTYPKYVEWVEMINSDLYQVMREDE